MQISFIGLNPHSTAQGAHPIIAPRLGDRWPCGGREACGFAAQLWFCCLCSLKLWIERLPNCQTFALCTDPGQVVGWISHTYDQAVLLFKTTWRISTGLLAVVVVILGWYALSIRVVCLSVRSSNICCPVVCLYVCLFHGVKSQRRRRRGGGGGIAAIRVPPLTASASCGKANMLFSFCNVMDLSLTCPCNYF